MDDGIASALALLSRAGVTIENDCVLYVTAEWLAPVDAVALEGVKSRSDGRQVMLVHRGDPGDRLTDAVKMNESDFRDLCRALTVTRLPASISINPPTSSFTRDHLHSTPSNEDTSTRLSDAELTAIRESAIALSEQGEFIAAATTFTQVLLEKPTCTKANFNMAVILQMIDEAYFAVDHMLRVVAVDDQDAVAHSVLRTVLYPAEPQLVLKGYASIVAQHAGHVRAAHSLATLRGEATTASAEYVRQVFDSLSDSFESKLVDHLEYRIPWQIVDALKSCDALPVPSSSETYRVVDLGCGTGLCGRLLRTHASFVAGIDLSPLMIEKTRETGVYDELETANIVPYLSARDDAFWDLIVSADVWIYVGALDEIFPLVARKLRPRGYFAFSTELLSTTAAAEFVLASSGRFKHSDAYIKTLAEQHGFECVIQQEVTVRKESGEPIPGVVYVLRSS